MVYMDEIKTTTFLCCFTENMIKQEGPEVAHLYKGPPPRCRANLTQGLLFAQTW
jgi:hypothetical protein